MEGIYINLNIGIAGLMISVLGLLQVLISRQFERWIKRFFISFFSIMVVVAVFNLIGQIMCLYHDQTHARIFRFTLFWESLLPSFLMLLLTVFLLRSSGETEWRRNRLVYTVTALWIVYVGLLMSTLFSPLIYSIDASNEYRRGPLYPLLLVPPVLIMTCNAVTLWRRRHQLSPKQRLAFSVYIIIPMISILIQMCFYGIYTILLGSSLAVLFMFNYIWIDQSERYYRQVQENKQLRIDIMLSQIQPHFLYNTLGAIQTLCKTDPAAAEKAVAKFSRYLRGNMDSISEDSTISFTEELGHTNLYLELEQLRYEDALQVSYDLECTEFRIPTLTLQPLVENAVRHGVRGKLGGRGTVSISTKEFADRYEIAVTDDGPGFDPERVIRDGRSHIGLANVRERLHRTVGGSLHIDSKPGAGTRAVIILPKRG